MSLIAVDELVKLLNEEEFERENVRYVALNLDGGSLQRLKLNTPLADISHIQVQSVQIPFSWYRFKDTGIQTNLFNIFWFDSLNNEEIKLEIEIEPGNYSGTDLAFQLNGTIQSSIGDSEAPKWKNAKAYIIGDTVLYNWTGGLEYQFICNTAHTSDLGVNDPQNTAFWTIKGLGLVPDWVNAIGYFTNDLVKIEDPANVFTIYTALQDHVSSTGVNDPATNPAGAFWGTENFPGPAYPDWDEQNKGYIAGDRVTYNDGDDEKLYVCIQTHDPSELDTNDPSFPAFWTEVQSPIEVLYFESTGKFTFQISEGAPAADRIRFDDVILPGVALDNDALDVMGFTVNTAPQTSIVSNNAANLTGSNIINVHSNELTRGSYYGSSLENISGTRGEIITENNIFFPVPVNVNPSYVVVERPTDFFIKYDKGSKRRIDNIDLELKYPNDGETVDLNGLGWSIILKIFQKVKRTDLV